MLKTEKPHVFSDFDGTAFARLTPISFALCHLQPYSPKLRAMETAVLCVVVVCTHVLIGLYRPGSSSHGCK